MREMELLAVLAIVMMSVIGWVLAREWLGKWIDEKDRLFFAPALGLAACGSIAYVAAHSRVPWLIPVFTFLVLAALLWRLLKKQTPDRERSLALRLFCLTSLALLCLYGMQLSVFQLFRTVYPGSHEVWDLYNVTGVSPPDQMFSWHQAMFADLHRHYPKDPFYGETDLYDRPHLGGYVTLFFSKLFQLPLTENQYVYPAPALRFYHCFWWLSNNLYLFAIAPLFRRLFGYRGAVLAVAVTGLSGFVFLCNLGTWTKFAAIYPFLLAILLFLKGKGPLLQAGLCAVSFYLHGSVLPFWIGFGLFQIFCVYCPVGGITVRFRSVLWFGLAGTLLAGAWFVTVRLVGSKQPLFYYYLYEAALTQAQTVPVPEIAQAFYAKHSWLSLSFLPLHNLLRSVWPFQFFQFLTSLFLSPESWKLSSFASAIFESQRFSVLAAAGLAGLPVTLAGLIKTLSQRYSGRSILALYLVPTLLMALLYRIQWSFSLHIMCLYHAFVLFLFASVLVRARWILVNVALAAIALEGVVCVLFADIRFLPISGLRLSQLTSSNWPYLAAYLTLVLFVLGGACLELRRSPPESGLVIAEPVPRPWLVASRKLLGGLALIVLVMASYALYCLRFY